MPTIGAGGGAGAASGIASGAARVAAFSSSNGTNLATDVSLLLFRPGIVVKLGLRLGSSNL